MAICLDTYCEKNYIDSETDYIDNNIIQKKDDAYDVQYICNNILTKFVGLNHYEFCSVGKDTLYYNSFEINYNIDLSQNYVSLVIQSLSMLLKCKIVQSMLFLTYYNDNTLMYHCIEKDATVIYSLYYHDNDIFEIMNNILYHDADNIENAKILYEKEYESITEFKNIYNVYVPFEIEPFSSTNYIKQMDSNLFKLKFVLNNDKYMYINKYCGNLTIKMYQNNSTIIIDIYSNAVRKITSTWKIPIINNTIDLVEIMYGKNGEKLVNMYYFGKSNEDEYGINFNFLSIQEPNESFKTICTNIKKTYFPKIIRRICTELENLETNKIETNSTDFPEIIKFMEKYNEMLTRNDYIRNINNDLKSELYIELMMIVNDHVYQNKSFNELINCIKEKYGDKCMSNMLSYIIIDNKSQQLINNIEYESKKIITVQKMLNYLLFGIKYSKEVPIYNLHKMNNIFNSEFCIDLITVVNNQMHQHKSFEKIMDNIFIEFPSISLFNNEQMQCVYRIIEILSLIIIQNSELTVYELKDMILKIMNNEEMIPSYTHREYINLVNCLLYYNNTMDVHSNIDYANILYNILLNHYKNIEDIINEICDENDIESKYNNFKNDCIINERILDNFKNNDVENVIKHILSARYKDCNQIKWDMEIEDYDKYFNHDVNINILIDISENTYTNIFHHMLDEDSHDSISFKYERNNKIHDYIISFGNHISSNKTVISNDGTTKSYSKEEIGTSQYKYIKIGENKNENCVLSKEKNGKNNFGYDGYKAGITLKGEPCIIILKIFPDSVVACDNKMKKYRTNKCAVKNIYKVQMVSDKNRRKGYTINHNISINDTSFDGICPICCTKEASQVARPCNHNMCLDCWIKIISENGKKAKCPYCTLEIDKIDYVSTYKSDLDKRIENCDEAYSIVSTKKTKYRVGSIIEVNDFDKNLSAVCCNGIHFHTDIKETYKWFEYLLIPNELKDKSSELYLNDDTLSNYMNFEKYIRDANFKNDTDDDFEENEFDNQIEFDDNDIELLSISDDFSDISDSDISSDEFEENTCKSSDVLRNVLHKRNK